LWLAWSAAGVIDHLDVLRRIALVGDLLDEGLAVLVLAIQVQAGFDEEADKALEIIDTQATVALTSLCSDGEVASAGSN
jgi:hypothetical protein